MAFVLGAVLIPLFGKALIAALAFIAPFAPFILVVTAIAAAFVLLYTTSTKYGLVVNPYLIG